MRVTMITKRMSVKREGGWLKVHPILCNTSPGDFLHWRTLITTARLTQRPKPGYKAATEEGLRPIHPALRRSGRRALARVLYLICLPGWKNTAAGQTRTSRPLRPVSPPTVEWLLLVAFLGDITRSLNVARLKLLTNVFLCLVIIWVHTGESFSTTFGTVCCPRCHLISRGSEFMWCSFFACRVHLAVLVFPETVSRIV